MGCIWSSEPSNHCSVCNCKESTDSGFINNKCRRCVLAEQYRVSSTTQSRPSSKIQSRPSGTIQSRPSITIQSRPSSTLQSHEYVSNCEHTSIPHTHTLNRSNVRGVLPQPGLKTISSTKTSDQPQFGEYYCKGCGRSWKSLRSWSTKYQMCKRCKNPVYPHKLRVLLSSDYNSTVEEPKEHERELCQMCKHLGYACKNYGKNVNWQR